jgi:hypothetical protein
MSVDLASASLEHASYSDHAAVLLSRTPASNAIRQNPLIAIVGACFAMLVVGVTFTGTRHWVNEGRRMRLLETLTRMRLALVGEDGGVPKLWELWSDPAKPAACLVSTTSRSYDSIVRLSFEP